MYKTMLAGIKLVDKDEVERIARDEKNHRKHEKRKKKKESRKHKRHHHHPDGDAPSSSGEEDIRKRGKKNTKHSDSDGSGDGSAPEDAWQQDQLDEEGKAPGMQREDWMTVPMHRPFDDSKAQDEEEDKAKEPENDPDKPKVSERELNPYFKAGGSGVPDESDPTAGQPSRPAAGVGDGGASWRLKALKRAKDQASEQGLALNEVVSERWGSLANLTSTLTDNKAAPEMAHAHAARERLKTGGRQLESRDRGYRDRNYKDDDRRDYRDRHHRDRDRDGSHGHQHSHRHHHSDRDAGTRDEEREGSGGARYLKDVKSGKSQMKRPKQPESLSWRRRDRQPPSDSDAHGGRSDHDARPAARKTRPPPRGEGPGSNALLQSVAKDINAFNNDGSFMEEFAAKQEQPDASASVGDQGPALDQDLAQSEPGSEPEEHATRHQDRASGGGMDMASERRALASGPRHAPAAAPTRAAPAGQRSGGGNLSAAALLKARLLGKAPPADAAQEETVVLPLVDHAGRAVPGAFGREAAGAAEASHKPGKKVERYAGGEKRRYFADDDAVDLDTLVKRTKYEGAGDIDRKLAQGIARKSRFKETDLDPDEEYDNDAGIDMLDKKPKKRAGTEQAAQKEKQRQIREYNKYTSAVDRCQLCFTSKSRPRHLTVAIGQSTYLAIPPRGRLVPGHCQIIPAEHIASSRITDEGVWTEIRNFKKCLIQMYMKQGKDVVFWETATGLSDMRSHAVIDCVPIPRELSSKAPMYFKKAIDDATSEWSQHHAKRIIDTRAKGLRGSIPPNFPYLYVEFGISDGFVHVIDDESKFDRSLARSVLIGLLKLPAEDMHRQAKKEGEAIQQRWVEELRAQFDEFDWTKMLQ